MDGVVSPTSELGGTPVDTLHESPTLDAVAQCNLNDLQSYLVNFNKEIEGNNEATVSFQNCMAKALAPSNRPVFVTLPVSSGSLTPDEEQLPVMSVIKEHKSSSVDGSIGGHMSSGELSLCDAEQSADQMIFVEMDSKQSPEPLNDAVSNDGIDNVESKDSAMGFHDQTVEEEGGLESMDTDRIQLQELNMEQIQLGLNNQIAVPEGMVMLPLGDVTTLLSNTDPRLVQIVNVNGQPTLQFLGAPGLLPQTNVSPEVPTISQSQAELNPVTSNSNQMSLLASVAACNNSLINQLHTSRGQHLQLSQQLNTSPQLVAVQDPVSSQDQVMTLNLDDIIPVTSTVNSQLVSTTPSPINQTTGYQSVAILPSGDGGQQGEVNYVLIVNPAGDSEKMQGPVFDFGNNIQGEVVEEMVEENGVTKRVVKINRLLSKMHNPKVLLNAGDELSCTVCDYTSPQRYLLKRHMKTHSADRPHKCGICNRGFKTMSSLQNHINTHTGVRPHKCKMCESAFTTSGELVRHIRYKHTFEKPHKCTECEYASVELSKLKRHMRSHTGERPYACQYCNYASPDTYKLKRHMRIHTGEKPYQCEVCQAKFTQSNSLKAHRLIHSGNKPVFKCSLCPATCGRSSDLKVHVQKLHGIIDQPLICKKCNAKFPDRYSFKVHLKSHEGEKCFKCPDCEYAAISQRHLDTHMLTHSGLKPFECDDCDLAFRQKQLLKRHRHLYHNTTYNPDDHKDEQCRECEKNFFKKVIESHDQNIVGDTSEIFKELDNSHGGQPSSGFHTCGGCPKSMIDIAPLTADQLIENSLLADMKEGKLGTSPKVVVVHPDGRVEEVTAKLQSLSQSKPMDDFLVSLGVSGDSHFDQVSSLPADVSVAEVNGLVSAGNIHEANVLTDEQMEDTCAVVKEEDHRDNNEDNGEATLVTSIIHMTDKDSSHVTGFDSDIHGANNVVVTVQNQPLDESDVEIDVEDVRVIQVDQPNLSAMPHVVINVVPASQHALK